MTTRYITRSALIAAIYVVLTIMLPALSYGPVQFRLSEILTLLPIFMIEAIPGLAIGCFVANMLSAYGVYDMIFGTMATLIAAILTYLLRKKILLAGIPPVLINALIIPLIFIMSASEAAAAGYLFNVLTIFISQAIIIYALGIPLTLGIKRALPLQNRENNLDSKY